MPAGSGATEDTRGEKRWWHEYLSRSGTKRILRRMDGQGVRMTGEMRERVVGELES